MEGQFFFTAVAGLALSLAGFASIIAGLRSDSRSWDPINLWRVKTIVRQSLAIVFLAMGLIPIFSITGDIRATTRLGSAGLLIGMAIDVFINRHPDPDVWVPKASWTLSMVFSGIYAIVQIVNLSVASLGILQIGYLLELLSPAGIFSNFVRELGRKRPQPEPVDDDKVSS